MLEFTSICPPSARAERTVTLPWDVRQKSRFLARLDDGEECGFVLPRGGVLNDGVVLGSVRGVTVRVRAAPEDLSVAWASEPFDLLRAAYHLGNRHVPVELSATRLGYQHDHVLDDMVRSLGLRVTRELLPFSPESGAYRHAGSRAEGGQPTARHGHGGHAHGHGVGGHSHGGGGHEHG